MDPAQPQGSSDSTPDVSVQPQPMTTPIDAVVTDQIVTAAAPQASISPAHVQPAAHTTMPTVSQQSTSATLSVPATEPQLPPPQQHPGQPAPETNTPAADLTLAVAMPVVQAAAAQPQTQTVPVGSAADKERVAGSTLKSEHLQVPEVGGIKEVEPDVESWLEKKEEAGEIKIPEAIKDEHGAVVLDNAPATRIHDQVVVPISQQGLITNKKRPIEDAAKWLAFWVERIAKMFGDRVKFKES